ncbi:Ty3/gypsy retrotransposon protein [Quillaja saponaria]|uniref:Ty3/gypsy retrotransposon protein n=1 Tax=Quillaja saponaria TaxID=32244 RepID=A0AAD7LLA1_QUISA|nr:Ty3/gypsy retrotransposon protein [Quillaja saponaria]
MVESKQMQEVHRLEGRIENFQETMQQTLNDHNRRMEEADRRSDERFAQIMEELRRMRGGHDQNLQAQGGQLGQGNRGMVPGINLVPELQTMGIGVGGHQAPEIPRNINIAPGIPEIPIFGNLDGLQGRNPIPEGQMGGIPRGRGQEAMDMGAQGLFGARAVMPDAAHFGNVYHPVRIHLLGINQENPTETQQKPNTYQPNFIPRTLPALMPPTPKFLSNPSNTKPKPESTNSRPNNPYKPTKNMSQKEMEEKRLKGLCYWCEEKYVPGHKCRRSQLYQIVLEMEEEEVMEYDTEVSNNISITEICEEEQQETPRISLHALWGLDEYQTMKIEGIMNNQPLLILVDSGSTHNFLDGKYAKRVGCRLRVSEGCQVTVANGEKVKIQHQCNQSKWQMQKRAFQADFLVMPLGGCHMVLGIQWLSTLGPILWDFDRMTMLFWKGQASIMLQGSGNREVGVIQPKELRKTSHCGSSLMIVQVTKKNNQQGNQDIVECRATKMAEEDIPKTAFRTYSGHYEYLVMPFGLTNAPSTFQSLMTEVFRPFLRKFVLVFIDDILIYSQNWGQHIKHLTVIFEVLRKHTLFVKENKCSFGAKEVEYLGHIITEDGVAADPKKIEGMIEWPVPKTVKALRGFLGLTGYYRKFVKGYGSISKPLTELLKKEAFIWSQEAEAAFQRLKKAMTEAPVLAMPNFNVIFIIEIDACGIGIGAVLMQTNRPIAFISKALSQKHQSMSTYEKEMLAIVFAVRKWSSYLIGRHFQIRTDHQSLIFLSDQRLTTPAQQEFLAKMMGFDYEICYKKGSRNVVANALSRRDEPQLCVVYTTTVQSELLQKIKQSWEQDEKLQKIIKELSVSVDSHRHYKWEQGVLKRKGKLVVGNDPTLKQEIIECYHGSPIGGHSGVVPTCKRIAVSMYWKGLKPDVKEFVKACGICQKAKYERAASAGLLQPLPIPDRVWTDIAMDFVEGLPKSEGMNVILVVVDRLSKYAHFSPLAHPFSAIEVAQVFMNTIFRLHGPPQSIVSDRDKIFLSKFWEELMKKQGIKQRLSTAYHPQTDGQTEVLNRCLETYLRCMTGEQPKEWVRWLPLAEYWYNTNFHSAIQTTPYQVLYGQKPPMHIPYLVGSTAVETVDRSLNAREEAIKVLKFHMERAQNRMRMQINKHRTDKAFQVGDKVYLKLQPYRQQSLVTRYHLKLSYKYFGPYVITRKVGAVAYELNLPSTSKIHPVFHVSQLKAAIGEHPATTIPPSCNEKGIVTIEPEAILDRRMVRKGHKAVTQVLIKWSSSIMEDATWEDLKSLKQKFPAFHP